MVAATLLSGASNAWALFGDSVELFASETVTSDSNLFRLSRDRDAASFLGTPDKGDTYYTTAVGFNLDTPISRQRLQAGLSVNHVQYQRFSDLNNYGHDGRATWLWQAGDSWNGQLGYTESKALGSFADVQQRSGNPLKIQRLFGNAAYLLTPSWQLQAGLSEQTQRNGNLNAQVNDVNLRDGDFSVNYLTPANNRIGINLRVEDGTYPTLQPIAGFLVDNAYEQRSLGIVTDWTLTGKSHLNFRVDRVRRDFDQLPQRDFSGTTFRAVYDWKATGKLTLTGLAQRDISPAEDIRTSFVLSKELALTPSFALTEKIKLSGTVDYSIRDYLGDPGLILGGAPSRTDHLRVINVMLSYQPTRSLTLQLLGQREQRTSTVPLDDYATSIFSASARLSF